MKNGFELAVCLINKLILINQESKEVDKVFSSNRVVRS